MLLRPAALGLPSNGISKTTDAHTALSVPCKSVLSRKTGTAGALVRLVASVNLCMTLEVMLSHKAFATPIALVLSVAEMCLDMRANILPPAEDLAAILVQTCPLVRLGILLTDVALDFFGSDAGILETRIEFKICVDGRFFERTHGQWQTVVDAVCRAVRVQCRKECGCVGEWCFLGRILCDTLEKRL